MSGSLMFYQKGRKTLSQFELRFATIPIKTPGHMQYEMSNKLVAVLVIALLGTPAFAQNTTRVIKTWPPLLKRLPPPQCELQKQLEAVNPSELRVAALDYERQCYRQAEVIVHARLDALQEAIGKSTKSAKSRQRPIQKRQSRHRPVTRSRAPLYMRIQSEADPNALQSSAKLSQFSRAPLATAQHKDAPGTT